MKIQKELTADGFRDYVDAIQSCGDHPLPELTSEVLASVSAVLDCYIENRETWEDTQSRILVQLDGGEVGLFSEWADSSGHG